MTVSARKRIAGRLLAPAVLVFLAAVASIRPAAFVLDRVAVESGELWRLYTGHFVHATWAHFGFDVGVACVLLLLVPWRTAVLLLPPIVGGIVLLARPDLALYGGLSGVLHGLTVLVAVHLARGADGPTRLVAVLLLVGVIAKALGEAAFGASFFTGGFDMGGETVYAAHVAGVLGGLVIAGLDLYRPGRARRTLRAWAGDDGSSAAS